VQSLLSVFLVILIIVVLLVIFIPAWLERRARAHGRQRDELSAELQSRVREARTLERTLIPYARGRSAHFVAGTAATRERLAALPPQFEAAQNTLDALRCPTVHNYLLPVQHFVLIPRDVGAILSDTRRVSRLRGQLRRIAQDSAAAAAALEQLVALPAALADERRAVAAQLDEVEATLRVERAAGIEQLDDLSGELNRLRGLLARQQATADGQPAALDEGAAALEEATTGAAALVAQSAELAAARARLDERLQRAADELDDAAAGIKSGPETAPPATRPPLRRAAVLLNETAADHRRRRDFAAAEADAAAALRLVALARDAAAADERGRLLADRDDGVSLAAPIADLRRELTELFDGLEERLGSAAREATLVARAAELRRRAESLVARQDEVIAGLEREAAAIQERLTRGWEAARQLLPLAADDPLARRHAALLAAADGARRNPTALEQFRRDVAEFEAELAPWVTRVQAGRRRVAGLRTALPETIDAALTTAGPWACLAPHVAFIQQRAADFETTQAHFAAARRRREAEPLLEELAAIERDVAERHALLNEQESRLRYLESDVQQIMALAAADADELPPDDPARPKRERAMSLIAHHTAQAHSAARYEDASLALSRAADLANRLAV
jgi:TolA-binding protein